MFEGKTEGEKGTATKFRQGAEDRVGASLGLHVCGRLLSLAESSRILASA